MLVYLKAGARIRPASWRRSVHDHETVHEVRPYVVGEDLTGVQLTHQGQPNYQPVEGDFVVHNPSNPTDSWLMDAAFFAENYE